MHTYIQCIYLYMYSIFMSLLYVEQFVGLCTKELLPGLTDSHSLYVKYVYIQSLYWHTFW